VMGRIESVEPVESIIRETIRAFREILATLQRHL